MGRPQAAKQARQDSGSITFSDHSSKRDTLTRADIPEIVEAVLTSLLHFDNCKDTSEHFDNHEDTSEHNSEDPVPPSLSKQLFTYL